MFAPIDPFPVLPERCDAGRPVGVPSAAPDRSVRFFEKFELIAFVRHALKIAGRGRATSGESSSEDGTLRSEPVHILMFSELRRRPVDHDIEALKESKLWLSRLTTDEYQGPGDTIGAARGRLADKLNIPASYFNRMWNRSREMTGVAGGAYRALQQAYQQRCAPFDRATDGDPSQTD
ncbi:hypothetical protein DYI37_04060 [Fulvimarina endophytica]|uniref:Uncharacterized protein n=1 Tax=Fulvimarina endophytica TaxID=2293836 RepID=A0A371X747_9HYPH|nr:hypothetical protein [Fulvimarina endophytica]RFC65048.1 hypothetical protein DYI37_04060 [Fulvimarina endophytica]